MVSAPLAARVLSGLGTSTSRRPCRQAWPENHAWQSRGSYSCLKTHLVRHLECGRHHVLQKASGGTSPITATAATASEGPGLVLPPSDFSRIRKAVYVRSSVDLKGCPTEKYPEFAVIGRSNVGKSSLINMLTQNDKLAKVSKEPGMTKCINHFLINDSWYLVDLPGYGFAKAAKDDKSKWLDFTKEYFLKREPLVCVLLLVDATLPPQQVDLECANWLGESEIPYAVVFTKVDAAKKKGPTPGANMKAFKQNLLQDWEELPACFATSARQGKGRAEVLNYLASLRKLEEQSA